jgi:hypothetical protein
MLEMIFMLCIIIAALILFLSIVENVIDSQNKENIHIDKLHPASYRKVENRFKEIKEDFIHKKFMYEKKEIKKPLREVKKRSKRRPHVRLRFKEDEEKELKEEEKFYTSGGSAENSGTQVSLNSSGINTSKLE